MTEGAHGGEILFVCTGNVARSPYMEYALRRILTERGRTEFTISSAGVAPLPRQDIAGPIGSALAATGSKVTSWEPRRLSRELLEGADLVLTAERSHVADVVRLDTAAARRTFTARQFARLLSAAPTMDQSKSTMRSALERLVDIAHRARGTAGRQSADDDIVDPWRRSSRTYRRSISAMDQSLAVIADKLIQISPPGRA